MYFSSLGSTNATLYKQKNETGFLTDNNKKGLSKISSNLKKIIPVLTELII